MAFLYSQDLLNDIKEAFPDELIIQERAKKGDTLPVERFLKNTGRTDLYQKARNEWAERNKDKKEENGNEGVVVLGCP